MNRLPFEKRRQILHLMVEGNGINAISRLTEVSKVTVLRYLALAGVACMDFHDKTVRDVKAQRVECDEIWSFNYCKRVTVEKAKAAPEDAGDVWTWTALDADSKLIVSYLIGPRNAEAANDFMFDVADRLANRVQLTTDGFKPYLRAVVGAFGIDVDYAMLVKMYGESANGVGPERKYSPGICTGARKRRMLGQPLKALVSTSYVEKHNEALCAPDRRSQQEADKSRSHGRALHGLV
jgi:hypothetical protein